MNNDSLAQEIVNKALACGYDGCGILRLNDLDLELYDQRMTARLDRFPESVVLYKKLKDLFANIKTLYPWARAVIICKFWMGKYKWPPSLQGRYGKAFLLSPESAPECKASRDRHTFREWLTQKGIKAVHHEEKGPAGFTPLRPAAAAAGLGIIRRNNFFYDQKGSWNELDGFLIDQDLEHITKTEVKPCPQKCRLCVRGCPTGSLCEPHTMNPLTCVSFITTFGGAQIPPPLHDADLKDWICGCDACQDACPFNKAHDWTEGEEFEGLESLVELLQPQNLIEASDETLREKVIPKTVRHLRPEQTETLRICARRVLFQ